MHDEDIIMRLLTFIEHCMWGSIWCSVLIIAIVLGLSLSIGATGAPLLPEGSFESDGWVYYRSGGGWQNPERNEWQIWEADLVSRLVPGGGGGNVGVCDPAGDGYAWMHSTTAIPPDTVWVELDAACWGWGTGTLAVILSGQMFEWPISPGTGWQQFSGQVIETKSSSVVWLGFAAGGDNRVFVDSVSVHTPEPAGWMALAAGVIGLRVMRRQRK